MRFHNAHAQRSLAAETWQNIQIYAIQHNTTVFDIAQLPKIRSTHRWAEVTQVGLPGIRYLTELSTWLPHKRHSHKNIGSWISGFHWFCIFLGIYNRKRFIWGVELGKTTINTPPWVTSSHDKDITVAVVSEGLLSGAYLQSHPFRTARCSPFQRLCA